MKLLLDWSELDIYRPTARKISRSWLIRCTLRLYLCNSMSLCPTKQSQESPVSQVSDFAATISARAVLGSLDNAAHSHCAETNGISGGGTSSKSSGAQSCSKPGFTAPSHPLAAVVFFVNSGNAPNFEHVHFGTCRIYPYLTLVEFETCLEPGETTIKRYLQVQIMEDGLGEDPLLAACAALPSPANDLQMAGSSWRCFQWCLTWTKARKEIYARKRFVKWTHLHPEQPKWIMPSDLSLKEGAEVHCCSSCNANSMPNQNEARTTRRVSLPKENSYSVAFSGFRGIDSSTALFYTNTEISSSITSRSSEVTHQIRPKLKAQTRRLSPGHSSASPPRAMASAKSKAFLGGHPKILGLRTSKDQALDINWRVDDPWWSLMIPDDHCANRINGDFYTTLQGLCPALHGRAQVLEPLKTLG